jgi:hypothetical protein
MIGKVIFNGLKFGFSFKRMLPYVLTNLILFYTICDMLGRIGPTESIEEAIRVAEPLYGLYLFVFLICGTTQPLFIAMILHQAKNFGKKMPIKKSLKFSFSVFLKSFFLYLILLAVFSLLGFIPLVWPILILMFYLASFYVYPIAIIDNKRISQSFKKSFSIFKKRPVETFLVFLLVSLLSIILVTISSVPFFLWIFANMFLVYQRTNDMRIVANTLSNLLLSPTTIPFLFLLSLGSAFVCVMKIGTIYFLYSILKRKA